jgi:hypothetical protein
MILRLRLLSVCLLQSLYEVVESRSAAGGLDHDGRPNPYAEQLLRLLLLRRGVNGTTVLVGELASLAHAKLTARAEGRTLPPALWAALTPAVPSRGPGRGKAGAHGKGDAGSKQSRHQGRRSGGLLGALSSLINLGSPAANQHPAKAADGARSEDSQHLVLQLHRVPGVTVPHDAVDSLSEPAFPIQMDAIPDATLLEALEALDRASLAKPWMLANSDGAKPKPASHFGPPGAASKQRPTSGRRRPSGRSHNAPPTESAEHSDAKQNVGAAGHVQQTAEPDHRSGSDSLLNAQPSDQSIVSEAQDLDLDSTTSTSATEL